MAGIAQGAEWIQVATLRQLLEQMPSDAVVQASPLGNLVIYDPAGPIGGHQLAYIDLFTETLAFEPEPPDQDASAGTTG